MPKSRPPYPAEFRQQSIDLAGAGRTRAELSRERIDLSPKHTRKHEFLDEMQRVVP